MITYILHSIALFRIGKKSGAPLYGLAWIPFLSGFVEGGCADGYDRRCGSGNHRWRISLLLLDLLLLLIPILLGVFIFKNVLTLTGAFEELLQTLSDGLYNEFRFNFLRLKSFLPYIINFFGGSLIFILLISIIGMIRKVLHWVCLNKIFELCVPNRSKLSLILSILFPGLGTAIVLLCNAFSKTEWIRSIDEIPPVYSPVMDPVQTVQPAPVYEQPQAVSYPQTPVYPAQDAFPQAPAYPAQDAFPQAPVYPAQDVFPQAPADPNPPVFSQADPNEASAVSSADPVSPVISISPEIVAAASQSAETTQTHTAEYLQNYVPDITDPSEPE